MNHSLVFECCQRLEKQGKTPSVALIRAQSKAPVSLQDAIAGLKQWRNLSAAQKQASIQPIEAEPEPAPSSLEARVAELESQVKELQQSLAAIKRADRDADH